MKLLNLVLLLLVGPTATQQLPESLPESSLSEVPPKSNLVSPVQSRADHPAYCKDYTWRNKTTAAGALIEDCITMMRTVQYGAKWKVLKFRDRVLCDHRTCRFSAWQHEPVLQPFRISHRDVLNLVNPAIEHFQYNGRVSAEGYTVCERNYGAGFVKVFWQLY